MAGLAKKGAQAARDLEALFAGVKDLFNQLAPASAVIGFGASPGRPKEMYVLHFNYSLDEGAHEFQFSDVQLNKASRKLIRNIIMMGGDMFKSVLRPTRMFVCAKGPQVDCVESQFVPDHRLHLLQTRTRKTRSAPAWLISVGGKGSPPMNNRWMVSGDLWYRWPKGIKGFRARK